jgi:two-component system NtrC family sensor kinase
MLPAPRGADRTTAVRAMVVSALLGGVAAVVLALLGLPVAGLCVVLAAGAATVVRLVRELALSREQLKAAERHLVTIERMAAFGALGAGITHEVKNPITTLVGFAQLAQRRIEDRDKVLELLRIIESEGLRCRDILSSFLRFARGETRAVERVDLNVVAQESARVLRHQLVIHGVQLELALTDSLPPVVASPMELQQVVVNLALNAQQAMPKGGLVRLGTATDPDGGVLLTVTDDGPGIPAELQARVFEPFFTTKPVGEGTGLGLAVCSNIVASHHGSLSLRSAPGAGTTFTMRLPAAPPVADGPSDDSQAAADAAGSNGSHAAVPAAPVAVAPVHGRSREPPHAG